MKILIHDNPGSATAVIADMILSGVRDKPNAVLGLATGSTMEPVYEILRNNRHTTSFKDVTTFNLDEYVGLSPKHPQSYRHYMNTHLFDHIDIELAQTYVPRGDTESPNSEAVTYDKTIHEHGGIDLQILGLGANGHIGFNEPCSSLGSPTRVKTLTQQTRNDNERLFAEGETVPTYAITMGVGTIMAARRIILLATGAHKAQAVAAMVEGPVTAICPASVLQFHPDATIVLDHAAAGDLSMRDYYDFVHPNGQVVNLG